MLTKIIYIIKTVIGKFITLNHTLNHDADYEKNPECLAKIKWRAWKIIKNLIIAQAKFFCYRKPVLTSFNQETIVFVKYILRV